MHLGGCARARLLVLGVCVCVWGGGGGGGACERACVRACVCVRQREKLDTLMVYCCRRYSITMGLSRLFHSRFVHLPTDTN